MGTSGDDPETWSQSGLNLTIDIRGSGLQKPNIYCWICGLSESSAFFWGCKSQWGMGALHQLSPPPSYAFPIRSHSGWSNTRDKYEQDVKNESLSKASQIWVQKKDANYSHHLKWSDSSLSRPSTSRENLEGCVSDEGEGLHLDISPQISWSWCQAESMVGKVSRRRSLVRIL